MTRIVVPTLPELYFDSEEIITAEDIQFEQGEILRYHQLQERALQGLRPWRSYWARRIHESNQLLSMMAYDEGTVNIDAEF